MENSMEIHQKIRILKLPCNPENPLLGIYTKKTKTLIKKINAPLYSFAAFFTVVKIWKQPKCPSTDEWIKMSPLAPHFGHLSFLLFAFIHVICLYYDLIHQL